MSDNSDDASFFARFQGRVPVESIAGVNLELSLHSIRVKRVCHMDKIAVWVKYGEPQEKNTILCNGVQIFLEGAPENGFEIEPYANELCPESVVSTGHNVMTGQRTYNVMVPTFFDFPKEYPTHFEEDIMAAMAQKSLSKIVQANGNGREIDCSADSRADHGLDEFLAVAAQHGLLNAGFFLVYGGVPVEMRNPVKQSVGIELVTGTEIIAEGPLSARSEKRLKEKYNTDIYVGQRLVV